MNNKGNNIRINSITSICVQVGSIVQGLVIPRLLLQAFGSEINGLVSSISQFLNFFTIIEGGVIGVLLASLYLPISNKDEKKTGAVVGAAKQFLRKLSLLFVIYSILLGVVFPFINDSDFSWLYVFSLVLIISITTFFQYYFTIIPQLIVRADNKVYVYNIICLIFIAVNIVSTVICIWIVPEIHVVKLISAFAYLVQPIFLNLYIKRHYSIKLEGIVDKDVIKNRWSGFGSSVANLITTNTDVVLLTLFSSLKTVSIYSIYYSVINSIKNLISSIGMGYQSPIGQQIVKKNTKMLEDLFQHYEFVIYNVSGVVLSTCLCLIVPFVMLFTNGINDANYYQPLFAILICVAQYVICVREPYIQLTFCAGMFKETQNIAFLEAIINIVISICLVFDFGLVGVAIGTIASSVFRFFATIMFLRKNIIYRPISVSIKKFIVFFGVLIIDCLICWNIVPNVVTIFEWVMYGAIIFLISTFTHLIVDVLFYREEFKYFISSIKREK